MAKERYPNNRVCNIIGQPPRNVPVATAQNKRCERLRLVIVRAASAMIVPAIGAMNRTKKPITPAIKLPRKDRITEVINANGTSFHSAVSKIFCWPRTHSLHLYPVGVLMAHFAQIGFSQRLHRSDVSVLGWFAQYKLVMLNYLMLDCDSCVV